MKNFMKELKPYSLEDIIAGIALYRPGPMDFIPQYIKGKNNRDDIIYDCPQLEPILEPTYGCIVYQEQVMQIVRDLAGYTLDEAICCAVPCLRKRARSCNGSVRTLYTAMRKKAYRAALRMVSMKQQRIKSMMR